MRRRGLIPLIFILLVTLGGLTWTVTTDAEPQLGLDLQGGISVVLAPEGDADDDALDEAVSIIRNRVDALGVAEPVIARQGDNVVVELPGVENQQRALELVGETAELQFRPVCGILPPFGTDLGEADPAAGEDTTSTTVAGETTTTVAGDTTTVPAGEETGAGLFGSEGELAGGPTDTTGPGESDDTVPEATTTTAPGTASTIDPATATVDPTTGEPTDGGAACPTDQSDTGPDRDLCQEPLDDVPADGFVVLPQCGDDNRELPIDEGGFRYLVGPTLVSGRALETAAAGTSAADIGQWEVRPTFRSGEDGIDQFNAAAAVCFAGAPSCPVASPQGTNGQLAIVLDDQVVSAPSINTPSFQRDQIVISGSFGESDAKDLATSLKYGALPIEFEDPTVDTVSASLGEESLRAGIIAGAIGVALVCLYMLAYYRGLGLVAIASLLVWAALLWTAICFLSETAGLALTLAGVTGLIVSVGVTVDSYIVYFERLKDDVRAGKSLRTTVSKSFDRAFTTILTANVAALIGAVTLYLLTVGPVRGFALFLAIATVLDVAVVWFFTRPMAIVLGRSRLFRKASFLGVDVESGEPARATGGRS